MLLAVFEFASTVRITQSSTASWEKTFYGVSIGLIGEVKCSVYLNKVKAILI